MKSWCISIPCWGDYHYTTLTTHVYPALCLAFERAKASGKLIIHTDDDRLYSGAFSTPPGLEIEIRPVEHGHTHHDTYGNCHRDVIRSASPGEWVMLMNADIVVSRETFTACAQQFASGKDLIVAAATRCLFKPGVTPPFDVPARELLAWTLGVKHPSVAQCFWGGRSMIPWALYFQSSKGTVLRGFHLHPLAFLKRENLTFHGTSLDEHLIEEFSLSQIHVVTSPDEMALAELSPPNHLFKLLDYPMTEKSVYMWAAHRTTEMHRWLFEHRIILSGTDEDGLDIGPCNLILEKLRWSRNTFNGLMLPHFVQVLKDEQYDGCRFFAKDGKRVAF